MNDEQRLNRKKVAVSAGIEPAETYGLAFDDPKVLTTPCKYTQSFVDGVTTDHHTFTVNVGGVLIEPDVYCQFISKAPGGVPCTVLVGQSVTTEDGLYFEVTGD